MGTRRNLLDATLRNLFLSVCVNYVSAPREGARIFDEEFRLSFGKIFDIENRISNGLFDCSSLDERGKIILYRVSKKFGFCNKNPRNKCELSRYRMGLKRGAVERRGLKANRPGWGGLWPGDTVRVPRWRRHGGGWRTITRSDILRRTMRCNSLYPVEGEPSPISATKLCRLNSHDRSHYLPLSLSRSRWRYYGRSTHSNYFHRFTASSETLSLSLFFLFPGH